MILSISPSLLNGVVQAPASKSYMQRACAAALISGGKTIIENFGISNDDNAALDIIEKLGAKIKIVDGDLVIESNGVFPNVDEINCGESGLSFRMFTSIVALSKLPITINGSGSLLERPMSFFDEVFPKLNIEVKTNKGKLPILIKGPIVPKTIWVDGSLSSQFLTGLLFAFSACNACDVSINVSNLKSKPYVDLTIDILNEFGLKVPENNNYESFYFDSSILPNSQLIKHYKVEGDWSGSAFLLVAGAISGTVKVKGLNILSKQADTAILKALTDCGCELDIQPNEITISNSGMLKPFNFDATECPDLFPPLVALAAYCEGNSIIKGVSRLTHKESNRALSLQEEFGKLGVIIKLNNDEMIIYGGGKINGTILNSHHDHRIAMACAVVALKCENEIQIINAEVIDKSYPNFYKDFKSLNAKILIVN
jgi:3-phosphoshikimate 1-carboxyvinyltransferase